MRTADPEKIRQVREGIFLDLLARAFRDAGMPHRAPLVRSADCKTVPTKVAVAAIAMAFDASMTTTPGGQNG